MSNQGPHEGKEVSMASLATRSRGPKRVYVKDTFFETRDQVVDVLCKWMEGRATQHVHCPVE
jgi:hypothetical protein